MHVRDHTIRANGWPTSLDAIKEAPTEVLEEMMAECPAEPADPVNCLACYAYMVVQFREHATPELAAILGLPMPTGDQRPRLVDTTAELIEAAEAHWPQPAGGPTVYAWIETGDAPVLASHWAWLPGGAWQAVVPADLDRWLDPMDDADLAGMPQPWSLPVEVFPAEGDLLWRDADGEPGSTRPASEPDEEEPVSTLVPPANPIPTTFQEFAAMILEQLRLGEMWAGWTRRGEPIYGDAVNPVPDGVVPVQAAEDLAVHAGIITANIMQQAADSMAATDAMFAPPGTITPPNREQRRRAARARGQG